MRIRDSVLLGLGFIGGILMSNHGLLICLVVGVSTGIVVALLDEIIGVNDDRS